MKSRKGLSTDSLVAIFLLLFCGVFIAASFTIRETNFGQMGSEVWPQAILAVLTVLSFLFLVHSVRQEPPPDESSDSSGGGFRGWLSRYRNAICCYVLFLLFLLSLPVLGMLLGGIAFVFAMLTVLGEKSLRSHLTHAAISIGAVGAMWAIFSYGLNVILPQGMIFTTL